MFVLFLFLVLFVSFLFFGFCVMLVLCLCFVCFVCFLEVDRVRVGGGGLVMKPRHSQLAIVAFRVFVAVVGGVVVVGGA